MSPIPLPSLPLLERVLLTSVQMALAKNTPTLQNVLSVNGDATGLTLKITPSGQPSFAVENLRKDNAGISAHVAIAGLDTTHALQATLGDFTIELTAFDLTLVNGAFQATHIAALLTIPFFTDSAGNPEKVDVELGVKSDGSFALTLAAQQSDPSRMTPDGLVKLDFAFGPEKITLILSTLELDLSGSDAQIVLSGRLEIASTGLNWPSFEFKKLGITSKGKILLDGGWIDLPSHTSLDFYGFHVGLQKIGFGSDDSGGNWIGFSGDVHLVEGIPLGGSVRGLRIRLPGKGSNQKLDVSFDGVGVSFEIPDVLTFEGEVDHLSATTADELTAAGLPPTLPLPAQVFTGDVDLNIIAAGGLDVDAKFIVGHFGSLSVFFLVLDAELPIGIILFPDISLWGIHGMFASNFRPDPTSLGNTWWDWYKFPLQGGVIETTPDGNIDPNTPGAYTLTDVNKWLPFPRDGAFAIGAGVTVGTSDDGFTASAAVTLALLLPGPVIMLAGKANILSKRISGSTADANFEALAVFDAEAESFDLDIHAHYQIPVVLEIEAEAKLHVLRGQGWYFAMGLPPHDQRIKARVFDLFETDAYFVASNTGLITGAWAGYRKSWDYDVLSLSVNAYIATLIAVQWTPIQIGGGIELHGELHVEVFGIGFGLTVDVLLEGCAPHPFWVHGEFHVDLSTPWPLPDIHASVSLSWGGDDGDLPLAPLALGHIDATLVDHVTVSDHYTLLSHKSGDPGSNPDPGAPRPNPDQGVVYDPAMPGLMDPNTAFKVRDVPDIPSLTAKTPVAFAELIPQDAHFTLSFLQPTIDHVQFLNNDTNLADFAPTLAPAISPLLPADDMSNINPNPPKIQWAYRHTLEQMALYQFDKMGNTWKLLAAAPKPAGAGDDVLDLVANHAAAWVAEKDLNKQPGDENTTKPPSNSLLKVIPYEILDAPTVTASWGGPERILGLEFVDQLLDFELDPNCEPAQVFVDALITFAAQSGAAPRMKIYFPVPAELISIVSSVKTGGGEFPTFAAPTWLGPDGNPLAFASTVDNPSGQQSQPSFTQTMPTIPPLKVNPISEISVNLGAGTLFLFHIVWKPYIKMDIVPASPALYALKTVTQIEAGRVGDGDPPVYKVVNANNPVVEFAYFQTASGPGAAARKTPPLPPGTLPMPILPPPFQSLLTDDVLEKALGNAITQFPTGGKLLDLATYLQWSWPQDGDPAAYYGYELNVEFNETYVNALYQGLPGADLLNGLHFRCVDRNGDHVLIRPKDIHVPSFLTQSALVGVVDRPTPNLPPPPPPPPPVIAIRSLPLSLASSAPASDGRARVGPPAAKETTDQQVNNLWPKPLKPLTRYTLDVVAGPYDQPGTPPPVGSLQAFVNATDPDDRLKKLTAYYDFEDNVLKSLVRIQFATSRYETFTQHIANAIALSGTADGMRKYLSLNDTDPLTWLAEPANKDKNRTDAKSTYLNARADLRANLRQFDPLADELSPPLDRTQSDRGQSGVTVKRMATEQAWQSFITQTAASFDGLVTALGRGDLASGQHAPPPPDTEVSIFENSAGTLLALLLESPDPFLWRRLWNGITLTRNDPVNPPPIQPPGGVVPLWSIDGTRALLIPTAPDDGDYVVRLTFQYNIGAEAPCITQAAATPGSLPPTEEMAVFSPIHLKKSTIMLPGP